LRLKEGETLHVKAGFKVFYVYLQKSFNNRYIFPFDQYV